jgi:hypothetical protein
VVPIRRYENFLDQEPQKFLSFRHLHGFGLRVKALAELRQRVREPQISGLIRSGEFPGGQFDKNQNRSRRKKLYICLIYNNMLETMVRFRTSTCQYEHRRRSHRTSSTEILLASMRRTTVVLEFRSPLTACGITDR